eukprot:jgi/Psemu1/217997/e_gw1.881.14.1
MAYKSPSETSASSFSWIRGVNIAGWLLAERLVTPYLFALNSCHLQGEWCFYPQQISAPPTKSRQHKLCDMFFCKHHLIDVPKDEGTGTTQDFPFDEKSLLSSFANKALSKEYMTFHWENFITKEDVRFMAEEGGVQYVKVPIPHYAMNDILDEEPWIDGQWMYFVRFIGWARQYGIQVWIDLHISLGMQADAGKPLDVTSPEQSSSNHWMMSPAHVERSIKAIKDMAQAVMDDNLRDVVTGFGILNEPSSADCPVDHIKQYSDRALQAVREIMGHDTAVYMSDSLNAANWNDGWWTDPSLYSNTFIDSHYYQVFNQRERALSPKQHIAYTCSKFARETESCCYDPKNKRPSAGVSRIVGEWSAGFDTLPSDKLRKSMDAIRDPEIAKPLGMDRALSEERKAFLKNHVQAQMVAYESSNTGVSSGWFFWTLKTEGGAFAEWDFTRGVKEGWIQKILDNKTDSSSIYGSCQSIVGKTMDSMSIVEEFPDPKQVETTGDPFDDDYVVSHGKTRSWNKRDKDTTSSSTKKSSTWGTDNTSGRTEGSSTSMVENFLEEGEKEKPKEMHWFRFFAFCFLCYGVWNVFLKNHFGFGRQRWDYDTLHRGEFNL